MSALGHFGTALGHAALMVLGMAWQTGWSLVLGFTISALLQVTVRADELQRALGGDGPKEVTLAAAGAASSSCSYASTARPRPPCGRTQQRARRVHRDQRRSTRDLNRTAAPSPRWTRGISHQLWS